MAGIAMSSLMARSGLPRAPGQPLVPEPYRPQPMAPRRPTAAPSPYEFTNTARDTGLRGSYTDPNTGVSWATGAGSGQPGSAPDAGGDAPLSTDDFRRWMSTLSDGQPPDGVNAPPPRVGPIGAADSTAADAAAFARAKDKVGQIGGGALASLRSAAGGRGTTGALARGTAGIVANSQGELGNVVREQTIQQLHRNADVADRNYQGEISQRGADMNYTQQERARLQAANTSRLAQSQALMSLLIRARGRVQ